MKDEAENAARVEQEANLKMEARLRRILALVDMIAFLVFLAGAGWVILLFPRLSSGNYFSENALLPGGGHIGYSTEHAQLALSLKNRFDVLGRNKDGIVDLIAQTTMRLGLDTSVREIKVGEKMHSIVVAAHHAPRGEGKECIVLTARYPDESPQGRRDAAASSAVLLSLMDHLSMVPWLSKDVIVLFTPSSVQGHGAIDAWLMEYHSSEGSRNGYSPRGGDIWAALSLSVPDSGLQKLALGIEGMNGQLPNLDLVNVAVYAARRSGLSVIVPQRRSAWTRFLPKWLAADCDTVHSLMASQASGVSTGDHGAFKPYKVEALTVEGVPLYRGSSLSTHDVVKYAAAVESTVRSISNLLERFHQSFFLYLITGEQRYVPVEKYLIPCGLMLAPLLIKALSTHFSATRTKHSTANPPTSKKDKRTQVPAGHWPILEYALIVGALCIGCVVLSVYWTLGVSGECLGVSVGVVSVLVVALYAVLRISGVGSQRVVFMGGIVHSQMLVAVLLGLSVTVLVNFSLGVLSCIIFVPIYLVLTCLSEGYMQAFLVILSSPFSLFLASSFVLPDVQLLAQALRSSGGLPVGLLCLTVLPAHIAFLLASLFGRSSRTSNTKI